MFENEFLGEELEHAKKRVHFKLWPVAQLTPGELHRFAMDDDETDCQTLDQFVEVLEAIVSK